MILVAHSYFLNHDPKQRARMTPYSPLGTLIAAACLRRRGHEVALFDATFARGLNDFETLLKTAQPETVAIMEDNFNFLTKMCTVRRREDTLAMVARAKQHGCRVTVNGPDSTDQPALYLAAGADAVILGEGEAALAELADHWSRGDARLDEIAGLTLPGLGNHARKTRPRAQLRDLDALPYPAWDLVDAAAYRTAWTASHGRLSWNMATSRGCPYTCNWCAKPSFGRGYQQRSAASVAQEMLHLKQTVAPDHVWFADDIFGLTAEWLQEFAAEVKRLGIELPFLMQSRANLMRADAVDALAEAGAEEVWLGVESGSQKILDAMEKNITVAMVREATRALKSRGIRACWFIQLGYPGESWDDLTLTRNLIGEERPDDIGVSVAYPLPGTRFHDLVQAQLGPRHNWQDSDDLAMLFQGTFQTEFYRLVRDLLHDEVRSGARNDCRWALLGREGVKHRSERPVTLATGS